MAADKKRSKLGIFNSIILLLNILVVAALCLSFLSVHISPKVSWIFPLSGLGFPYLLAANLVFITYWILRLKWHFLLSLVVILLGWNHTGRIIRLMEPGSMPPGVESVKLTSYNVQNLANDNVYLSNTPVKNNIVGFLAQNNPDILCLQELAVVKSDPGAFIDSLSESLGLPYHAYASYFENRKSRLDALIIFSRYPILVSVSISGDEHHNYGIYSDILLDGDTIRVFNVHLQSFHFRHEDYRFMSGLDLQFEENENIPEGSRRIIQKLKLAYEKRAVQVDSLMQLIAGSPHPVILCGDFNDTPNSYAYQRLTSRLTDAFMESGRGFGNTYAGKLPSFRIDYILYDERFQSWNFSRETIKLSDHYPISCDLTWKNE